MLRRVVSTLAVIAVLAVSTACGGGSADEPAAGPEGTDAAATPGDAGTISPIDDCAAFETAATTLVDATSMSTSDRAPTTCQFFDQTGPDGTSGRLFVTVDQSSFIDEPDLRRALGFTYDPDLTYTELRAPKGWTLAAESSEAEADPDFPRATTGRYLVLAGDGVKGILKCTFSLTQTGESGAAPPEPPTIDADAYQIFCDGARETLFTE